MESNISRDHLAMEAMKVILDKTLSEHYSFIERIKMWLFSGKSIPILTSCPNEEKVAKLAYKYADAMIAERDKDKEE
ncbi:MAG: hypothetical protein IJ338_02220 [Bacteroidaceae bacterium]|nr:hypothetical protein [Bacteroidaceae bacterium]